GHPPGGAGGAAHGAGALLHHHRSRGGGLPSLYVRGERLHPDPRPEAAAVPPAAALSAADAGVGRGAASCTPQSAAGKAPTALRDAASWHRARVRGEVNAPAWATGSRRCAHRNRRAERRRPPYEVHRLGTGRGSVGWSTRMRWPPNRDAVHTAIGGRKGADGPTRRIALAPGAGPWGGQRQRVGHRVDRKSTRLNSRHGKRSY